MARYYCKACRFRLDAKASPDRCPYCAREGTMGEIIELDKKKASTY